MNGMKLMRSCHIVARLDRNRAVWCDSRVMMIRTTSGFLGQRLTKQRSSRMNSFFAKMQLQEVRQHRSFCNPLSVSMKSSRSFDKWSAQQSVPLLGMHRRLTRLHTLGIMLQLLLRVLLHHRLHRLGARQSRRSGSSLTGDKGYSTLSIFPCFLQ